MGTSIAQTLLRTLLCLLAIFCLSACSPGYVLQAVWEQGKVLASRQQVASLVNNPATPEAEREKLMLVLRAREFGLSLGLAPGGAFTSYARIPRPEACWVVSAARKDAFGLVSWWFPFVGRVPYKGFFSPQDASDEARCLEKQGYETWVRGADAFSTLGWFDDPLLSTTLDNHPVRIANTVFHESLHTTLWLQDRVDLNESLANFVGDRAAIEFFEHELSVCNDEPCTAENTQRVRIAEAILKQSAELEKVLDGVFSALEALYNSEISSEEKIAKREDVFAEAAAPLRAVNPNLGILKRVNNAEILQLRLYYSGTAKFSALFEECGRKWACFLDRARKTK